MCVLFDEHFVLETNQRKLKSPGFVFKARSIKTNPTCRNTASARFAQSAVACAFICRRVPVYIYAKRRGIYAKACTCIHIHMQGTRMTHI